MSGAGQQRDGHTQGLLAFGRRNDRHMQFPLLKGLSPPLRLPSNSPSLPRPLVPLWGLLHDQLCVTFLLAAVTSDLKQQKCSSLQF